MEACESVAGGSEDGSGTWKSGLPSSAKLADVLKLCADTNTKFHKDGDERSKITDKLEKAMRLIWLNICFVIVCVVLVCMCALAGAVGIPV